MAIYLPLIIGSIFFYVLMIFIALKGKKKLGEPYDFLTYFPYELFDDSREPHFLAARLFEALAFLLPVAGLGYYLSTVAADGWGALSFPLGLTLMFFASALALVFVSLVPAKFPKEHTVLFFLSTATSLLTLAMVGFYFLNRYLLGEATNNAATLTVAIILFVFAAFLLLLLVNPKLAHWADMEKVAEKDGTVSLKRPRPFVMACSEWLTSFVYLLGAAVALIGFLLL